MAMIERNWGRLAALALAAPFVFASPSVYAQPAAPVAAQPAAPAPVAIPPLSHSQAEAALRILKAADLEGLKPADYAVDNLDDQARLSAAILRYARDVRIGRMEPSQFPVLWGLRPTPWDARPGLAKAIADDKVGSWLESLPPNYAGYHALRRGLARYRDIAAKGGWKPIPDGSALSLGAKGAEVVALRARLAAEDPAASPGATFDDATRQAVIRAQRRMGLNPTGVVDTGTRNALNQPIGQRTLQIIANMERWRWMPQDMPATRIQVNSAAAIVTLFKDDAPVLSMKAVSGKVGDETPILTSTVHSIVLNPPWNVPTSIATKELWPKEHAHPGYLARNGFKVIPDGAGKRLQQQAGTKSALGRYKFDFQNDYGVYLHDTPAQSGFSRFARQSSHGCVRLEKPAALAAQLLSDEPQWTPDAIQAAVDKGDTQRVRLTTQVPVFILYWTAFANADGQMNFRSDPYDWDRMLLQRVGVVGATT